MKATRSVLRRVQRSNPLFLSDILDYSKCGTKSKLTNEQLLELKILLSDPDKNYTIMDAKELIEERFGVKYSYKQVWEITCKKLGFNYCKPFIINNEHQ